MKLITLADIDVANKKILLRVDYNVVAGGKVTDEFRVRQSVPTIEYLLNAGCSIILISHNGRPEGKEVETLSLRPVAKLLAKLLGTNVAFLSKCVGSEVAKEAHELKPGQVMLLENLRFHKEEELNTPAFARSLANLAEVYIDDAFGAMHRAHASIVGVAKLLPHAAGLLVEQEFNELSKLRRLPLKPYTAVIGGAKVSDKLEVLAELIKHVDSLLIGGAMANTFLAAQGVNMQASLVETDMYKKVEEIIVAIEDSGVALALPSDVVVSKNVDGKFGTNKCSVEKLDEGDIALDIGPDTAEEFAKIIGRSKTVFWNGTMGRAEIPAFANGSGSVAHAILSSNALSIVGGGDTAAYVHSTNLGGHFGFVSTGGGASLEFLAGETLPGLEVLMQS